MPEQMTFSDLDPSPEWREAGRERTPDVVAAFDLIRECERVLPLVTDPSVGAAEREMLLRAAEKLHDTLELILASKNG
ncbi:MAG: hypothetical protein ACPLSY_03475 [Moorellaceae bacterium]